MSGFIFVFFAFPVAAKSTQIGDLYIDTPWARASIGVARPAVAYTTIVNKGQSSDVLIGIETSIAGSAEVHKMEMKDGVAVMGPVGPIGVPADGSVVMAPGALHIMLMKLKRPLKRGESFRMILVFEKAGRIDVSVPIYSVGASGPEE